MAFGVFHARHPCWKVKVTQTVEHPSLNQLIQAIKQVKRADYQEALVKELLKDIYLKVNQ